MVRRNLISNYVGQSLAALMGVIFVPLYIKYLGIESYGLIGIFAIMQTVLSLLDAGISPSISREMAQFTGGARSIQSIRDLLRSVEAIALGFSLLIGAAVFLSSSWISSYWINNNNQPHDLVVRTVTAMGIVCACRFIESIYRSAIIGLQRQVLLNLVVTVISAIRSVGAIGVLVLYSPTIDAFFGWQVIISLATLPIFYICTHRSIPKGERSDKCSIEALRGISNFAGAMLLIAITSILLTQVDKILLSHMLPLAEFGYYTFASLVAGTLYMIAYPAVQAWYPQLNKMHGAGDSVGYNRAFHAASQIVGVTLGSAAVFLTIFSEPLLQFWTKDLVLTSKSAYLVSIIAFGNLLNSLMIVPYHAQLSQGWTGLRVKINFMLLFIFVPIVFWVVPRYAAVGVAWTWVALNVGYILVGSEVMFRKILKTEKWKWLLEDSLYPIVAATTVGIVIRFLAPQWAFTNAKLYALAGSLLGMLCAACFAAPIVRSQWRLLMAGLTTRLRSK